MRQTTFIKSKINYFGSFGRQRTWALLAQGADVRREGSAENGVPNEN